MGCVKRDCGRYSDALAWFEKALPMAGDELEVGLFIGDICLRLKKQREAREFFEKVLRYTIQLIVCNDIVGNERWG